MNHTTLLNYDVDGWKSDDFELYKDDEKYYLSIEGYMGFKSLDRTIEVYETFLDKMLDYLTENNFQEPDYNNSWKTVHQSRSIHVCYEHDSYFVFLDRYENSQIWECYYYLEDIISQLIDINYKLSDE